ncbi:MAG: hypothetical protein ACRDXE_10555 [Acidimicrobiales bacterium]
MSLDFIPVIIFVSIFGYEGALHLLTWAAQRRAPTFETTEAALRWAEAHPGRWVAVAPAAGSTEPAYLRCG